ncbi:nucleoside hydrolase-like domain-containing protein [Lignipirellula cremea]|uniref:DUF1593 domain-containing protein n=1 Tax=Lignipirellula cremea TaxID=2528010 RepID=A0A518DVU6_9BACT|nr:nucleoside hydrolase-like domain-containing protein [Lignipirellula cremea]QDU95954.1 hypothetical protein Pla8534_37730 [Lignipirellula cremea]
MPPAICIMRVVCFCLAACLLGSMFGLANVAWGAERLRVMIETDAPGGDPDDEGSLVRFFLYLNEWDVEGIFCTRRADQSRNQEDGQQCLLRFIDAYAAAWPKLRQHAPGYPSPEKLRSITYAAFRGTTARDALIAAVDREDPRRIWYVNWGTNDGNLTAMRQALDHVKATRTEQAYRHFADRLCFSRDADRTYHVTEHIPYLHQWVDTRNPDRWYHRFAPLTAKAGGFDLTRDVKTGHGRLGSYYTIPKEGDTPGFMFLIPNGLSDVSHPDWGSWAGRFVPRTDRFRREGFFWSDARDQWNGQSNRDNTLRRWAVHLQNDFKARLDWCVADYAHANHPPVPMLNGSAGPSPVEIIAAPGEAVMLSSQGSSDPDQQGLSCEWIYYPEPGDYQGDVSIQGARSPEAVVTLPGDADGKRVHVLLVLTDNGEPALTRYRRAVIYCRR